MKVTLDNIRILQQNQSLLHMAKEQQSKLKQLSVPSGKHSQQLADMEQSMTSLKVKLRQAED